jgi:methionine ABC transporter, MUT family, ATP-binding protein
MTGDCMIEIKGLKKSFGKETVLEDISLEIKENDIFGLIGVSGAGKSTLLRCINGLEKFDEGSLKVNGVEIKDISEKDLRKFRKNIGMIFQHFSLIEREKAVL